MACLEGGAHSLEQEQCSGTSMQICTKCGRIMDQSTFAEKDTGPGTSYAPVNQGQNADLSRKLHCHISGGEIKPALGLTYGWSVVKDIGHLLKLSTVLIEDACNFYKEVYFEDRYHLLAIRNKKKVAACCLYIKCRQNSIPLTMNRICNMIQTDPYQFGRYYTDIVRHLNLTIRPFEFEQFIPSFCAKAQFSDRITKRVEDMVSFLDMTGNTTGYSYQSIVVASAFLAWKADDVKKNGHVALTKDSPNPDLKALKEFAGCSVRKHVKQLLEDFRKLAAELPWLRAKKQKLTNYTVLFHIDDVLRYRRSLFSKHMTKCDEMEEQIEEQFRWEISDETVPDSDTSKSLQGRVPGHDPSTLSDREINKPTRKPVAAAGSKNQLQVQWVGSVVDSENETQVSHKRAMNKDLNWIGSMLNSDDTAMESWDDDSLENELSDEGNGENSCVRANVTDITDTPNITDINTDTPNITDINTDILDLVISNGRLYTCTPAVGTVQQTSEGELIFQVPASKIQTAGLECGDQPKKIDDPQRFGVFDNVTESCASRCDGDNVPLSVGDLECSGSACGNNVTSEIKTDRKQAALHSANLNRVKRKYSRCIVPRSFKKARILEAEKGAIQKDPVETIVHLDSSDDSEIDDSVMSDGEVDQYLRTPQEVRTLKALHEKGAIEHVCQTMDD